MPSDTAAARRWVIDILFHIELAERFLGSIDYETFRDDLLRLYAVTRCLEIISEASRRLPAEMKARHPSIARKEMAAAGNVYRHDYDHVAARRVWQTLRLSLPSLRAVMQTELAGGDAP